MQPIAAEVHGRVSGSLFYESESESESQSTTRIVSNYGESE